MNTQREVLNFFTPLKKIKDWTTVLVNDFSWGMCRVYELKDKFYIILGFSTHKHKLEEFEAKLINIVKHEKISNYNHQYHVIVTKYELIQLVHDIEPFEVTCDVYYYTVNYNTFIKTKTYISDNFKVDAGVIYPRYSIDESSFYVGINCYPYNQLDIYKKLLGHYCDSIESFNHNKTILYARNVNEYFMSKFKLVSESLDSKIHGLIIGNDYYKIFED